LREGERREAALLTGASPPCVCVRAGDAAVDACFSMQTYSDEWRAASSSVPCALLPGLKPKAYTPVSVKLERKKEPEQEESVPMLVAARAPSAAAPISLSLGTFSHHASPPLLLAAGSAPEKKSTSVPKSAPMPIVLKGGRSKPVLGPTTKSSKVNLSAKPKEGGAAIKKPPAKPRALKAAKAPPTAGLAAAAAAAGTMDTAPASADTTTPKPAGSHTPTWNVRVIGGFLSTWLGPTEDCGGAGAGTGGTAAGGDEKVKKPRKKTVRAAEMDPAEVTAALQALDATGKLNKATIPQVHLNRGPHLRCPPNADPALGHRCRETQTAA
jgi:hypothetical protein